MVPILRLPHSLTLKVHALDEAFDICPTSYKYLWMQAILRALEQEEFNDNGEAPIALLAGHMIDIAKYPLRRFNLTFGPPKRDRVEEALSDLEKEWQSLRSGWFKQSIAARYKKIPHRIVGRLTGVARYRLLSPFFVGELRNPSGTAKDREIACRADESFFSNNPPFYRFLGGNKRIQLHPTWRAYMLENLSTLQKWVLRHWSDYLQDRNPSTPAIFQKLEQLVPSEPARQRKFWSWVIRRRDETGQIHCIYSGERLHANHFVLDHYAPWEFVCHNNLWNLVPVTPKAHSSKSSQLPSDNYLSKLVKVQHIALTTAYGDNYGDWGTLIDPYYTDLHVDPKAPLAFEKLHEAYARVMPPLLQLAENYGFKGPWRYGA